MHKHMISAVRFRDEGEAKKTCAYEGSPCTPAPPPSHTHTHTTTTTTPKRKQASVASKSTHTTWCRGTAAWGVRLTRTRFASHDACTGSHKQRRRQPCRWQGRRPRAWAPPDQTRATPCVDASRACTGKMTQTWVGPCLSCARFAAPTS